MDYNKLTKMQIDAIQEMANIGAGHAASALSQIIGKPIMISVSKLEILPLSEVYKTIGEAEDEIVAVHLKLLGGLAGGIALIFTIADAVKLANIMGFTPSKVPSLPRDGIERDENDKSSIKEAGAILSSAYLSAIGKFVKLSLIPSIPKIATGKTKEILSIVFAEIIKRADAAFCIETAFIESSANLKGYFLLIPEVDSLEIILNNLGVY